MEGMRKRQREGREEGTWGKATAAWRSTIWETPPCLPINPFMPLKTSKKKSRSSLESQISFQHSPCESQSQVQTPHPLGPR